MTITPFAVLLGILFMSQAGEINVEPGKQLPQSVTVHADDSSAAHDVTFRYLLFVPKGYKPDGQKWPLMLFLHGLGECSNDDLNRVKIHGPPKIVEGRPDFPFVVISPQSPPPPGFDFSKPRILTPQETIALVNSVWKPAELIQLVDHVSSQLNVDPDRTYVTGLSMGGYGTWRLAATHPDRFAAAAPICGGGDPDKMADGLSHVPIWAFHGGKDPVVPVAESKKMVDAVQRNHGEVRYTVYPDAVHDSWTQTYDNQELYDWLLAHRRAAH